MLDNEKYIQEVHEKFKTMPLMEPVEMKPKYSFLTKIYLFFKDLIKTNPNK